MTIKCCMKLCKHERDNKLGKQIENALLMLVILAAKCVSRRGFQSTEVIS